MMRHFCDFCGTEVMGNYQTTLHEKVMVDDKSATVTIQVTHGDQASDDVRKATCIDCAEKAVAATIAVIRRLRAADQALAELEARGREPKSL
jgi:hypothetical protein